MVCLCGSTRFLEAFDEASVRETLAGHVVLNIANTRRSDSAQLAGMTHEEADAVCGSLLLFTGPRLTWRMRFSSSTSADALAVPPAPIRLRHASRKVRSLPRPGAVEVRPTLGALALPGPASLPRGHGPPVGREGSGWVDR